MIYFQSSSSYIFMIWCIVCMTVLLPLSLSFSTQQQIVSSLSSSKRKIQFPSLHKQQYYYKQKYMQSSSSLLLTTRTRRTTTTSTNLFVWKAGQDIDDDFQRLEQAIQYSQKDFHQLYQQRQKIIQQFPLQQRQKWNSWYFHHIVIPFLYCWCLSFVIGNKLLSLSTTTRTTMLTTTITTWVSSILQYGLQFQFIMGVLLLPHILWIRTWFQNQSSSSNSQQHQQQRILQKESISDFRKGIVEQWCTAVVGGIIFLGFQFYTKGWTTTTPVSTTVLKQMIWIRILFRLATMCSIFQYPKWYYQLQNPIHPIDGFTYFLQKSITNGILTPWWIGLECILLLLLFFSGYDSLGIIGQSISSTLSWWCWRIMTTLGLGYLLFPFFISYGKQRWIPTLIAGWIGHFGWKHSEQIVYGWVWWTTLWTMKYHRISSILSIFQSVLLPWFLQGMIFLGPCIHIIAFLKLIHMQFSYNSSLISPMTTKTKEEDEDDDTVSSSSSSSSHTNTRPQWYISFRWREPQRIRQSFRKWRQQLFYSIFLEGSVDEQLRKQRQEIFRKEELQGMKVWERIQKQKKDNNNNNYNATQWKENAMKQLAEQHARDYENGTFEDPLGIAVYKTLGIGLGFPFDHMSNTSTIPETRRLQARAAKSAVRRIQDMYRTNAELLQTLPEGIEKQQKRIELKREIDEETNFLAKRLAELIPVDMALDNANATLVRQIDTSYYERVSNNEYIVHPPHGIDTFSPAVQELMKSIPEDSNKDDHHDPDDDDHDDELMEWEKQMTTLLEDENDEDNSSDTMKTYLA